MPELQIDLSVANRFISSLSKSLQALCHGCMDFDNGIEIVGYININIDSGSKVDYVLNEKVLKSTTNSMTFVSNSFVAKKEQQKQTRDGACSPNPQPQAPSYPQIQGARYSSPYEKMTAHVSSYTQFIRGSQKRARPDNWSTPSKKHSFESTETSFPSPAVQHSHSHMMSLPNTTSHTDSNFKLSQTYASSDGDPPEQLQLNIKKEALELESHNKLDTEIQSEDHKLTASDQIEKFHVKSDPDDPNSFKDKNSCDENRTVACDDTDMKHNFLEHCTSEQPEQQSTHTSETDNISTSCLDSESVIPNNQTLTDESNVPSTSAINPIEGDSGVLPENEPNTPIDYDEAAEEESNPQSAYDDVGEGSSDAGQFEVIEIDDEDEDVQAMFGDHRNTFPRGLERSYRDGIKSSHQKGRPWKKNSFRGTSSSSNQINSDKITKFNNQTYYSDVLADSSKSFTVRAQIPSFSKQVLPYICSLCGKGYISPSGLSRHRLLHKGMTYMCPVCDSRFTQKSSVKTHLREIHKSLQCLQCFSVFLIGQEYDDHMQQCISGSKV